MLLFFLNDYGLKGYERVIERISVTKDMTAQ